MSSLNETSILEIEDSRSHGILHSGDGEEHAVEGFRQTRLTTTFFWIMVIFSLGLFYLFYRFVLVYRPYYAMQMRYKRTSLEKADRITINDVTSGLFYVSLVHTIHIRQEGGTSTAAAPNITNVAQSSKSGEDASLNLFLMNNRVCETDSIKYVEFHCVRFVYSKPFNAFYPLTGLDGDNPMVRPRITKAGLKSDDVRILQKVYGPNTLNIRPESYLEIFTNNILDSFYAFQIFTLALWCYAGYYFYCAGIVLVTAIIVGIALFILRREETRQQKDLKMDVSVTVARDGYQYYISYTELVPGDIVVLNKSSPYLTFDGTVIQGGIYIDNASLNGATKPYYRAMDPSRGQGNYHRLSLDGQKDSVFAGTEVVSTQPEKEDEDVLVLVVNIGFLTRKGQVFKEARTPDNYMYFVDEDSLAYLKFLLVIGVVAFGVALIVLLWLPENELDGWAAVIAALRLATLSIPPSLPLALTTAFVWSVKRLSREKVGSLNFRRIPVGGKISVVVFDKTGTLTTNRMEYAGRIEPYMEEGSLEISGIDTSRDVAAGDVLYLMATCHSVTVQSLRSTPETSTIDRAMFGVSQFDLVESGSKVKVFSGRTDTLGEMKIELLRRFPFSSSRQFQGVIVNIAAEERHVYYAMGKPERVMGFCESSTIPKHTSERIKHYGRHGYIVVAMAARDLSLKEITADVEKLQSKMRFIGLLVFGDTLADGAKEVVTSLHKARFSLRMCTGDSLDTAVHVARQVGIIPERSGSHATADRVVHMKARMEGDRQLKVEAFDYDTGEPYKLASAWGETWERPNFVLDGTSFNLLDDYGGSHLDRVINAGKVFAGMKPKHKKAYVELLRKIGCLTCMVGDGYNDNDALKAADIGVSLLNCESGLAAPFYSKTRDIRSVPVILNEGRTIVAQILTIFMFTACYSVLGMFAELMMYYMFYELSEGEWIYIDLFLVMSIDLMLGYSESRETIVTRRPSRSFFNRSRLLSMLAFLVVCVAVQIGFILYLHSQDWYVWMPISFIHLTAGSYESTYIFLLLIYQLTYPAIVYTLDHEPIYKNTLMMCLMAVLYAINAYLVLFSVDWVNDLFEFNVSPSISFRLQVLAIAAGNLVVNILVQLIFIFVDHRERKKY